MKRIAGLILLLIVVLGCIWGAAAGASSGANRDLQRLLPLSREVMSGQVKVVLKHIGTYKPCVGREELQRTGERLSGRFGLPVADAVDEGGHLLYKAAGPDTGDVRRTLLLAGFPDGTTELIVAAETPEGAPAETILAAQKKLSAVLDNLGVTPNWNVIVQGEIRDAYVQPAALQAWLGSRLQAAEVERYEDAGSISVSYASPLIQAAVDSRGRTLNLQVAVHRSSETGRHRLTIGTPVITTEY